MKCGTCGKPAVYKSNLTLKMGKNIYVPHYCEECKKGGIDFGWLEPDELEGV